MLRYRYWHIPVLMLAFAGSLFMACKKYRDPPPTDGYDGQDTSHYCNNQYAINYNWGFPGTPDSTTCIFPVDVFKGSWLFTDTVYLPDSTVLEVSNKSLVLTATEDTMHSHLAVSGWCSNGEHILITADRFKNAITDTVIPYSNGSQYLCSQADTISGRLNKYYNNDSFMQIDFTINTANGIQYHTGTAVKQ